MSSGFFDATDELGTIFQWARARYAAPWAVFVATLLRVAASTGPHVQLPGIIGGPASLNMIAAFVAPSGGGKGISDKVAREVWPAPIIERPVGSGEGIAALFAPPKKEGVERISRAIISVSEIDSLAGIASRQGSILLAQLKAMVMGELLGQSNASEATTRVVLPHTYRCCMSLGAQPGHLNVIFADASGGTPQRVLWVPTTDPEMPATPTPDPAALNTTLPAWATRYTENPADVVLMQYGIPEIANTIISAHLARQRGEADALDGHATLMRAKVAALLAVMHHRSVVTALDWDLSAEVMATSDKTREWIVEQARQADRAKVRSRAMARAAGEDFYESSRLDTVKRSVVRMLERDGEQASSDLRRRLGRREKRDLFDQAVSLLQHEELVVEVAGRDRGTRYRIAGHGDQAGHPPSPQVSEGDHVGHGDQPPNVTDLNSRRSHDSGADKPSCTKWLTQHLEELRAAGEVTVTSLAVYEAGMAAGYLKGNLKQAAANHPDIRTIDRRGIGGNATWSIDPTATVTEYQPAPRWLDDYLDRHQGQTLDPDDVRAAAARAGHPWDTIRRAAGRSLRIESLPARGDAKNDRVWQIAQPREGEQPA